MSTICFVTCVFFFGFWFFLIFLYFCSFLVFCVLVINPQYVMYLLTYEHVKCPHAKPSRREKNLTSRVFERTFLKRCKKLQSRNFLLVANKYGLFFHSRVKGISTFSFLVLSTTYSFSCAVPPNYKKKR